MSPVVLQPRASRLPSHTEAGRGSRFAPFARRSHSPTRHPAPPRHLVDNGEYARYLGFAGRPVAPAGTIGGEPAPPGQQLQYTVHVRGRLSTPEEFAAGHLSNAVNIAPSAKLRPEPMAQKRSNSNTSR